MTIKEPAVAATDPRKPSLLLVHGAWHGAWCWADLELERAQIILDHQDTRSAQRIEDTRVAGTVPRHARRCVGNPQRHRRHRRSRARGGPLRWRDPGHRGHRRRAQCRRRGLPRRVFMLDVGGCLFAITDQKTPKALARTQPMMDNPRTRFYSDVLEDKARRAVSKLVPQSVRSFGETVTKAGWRTIPATYIVCTSAQSLPPDLQEIFAVRAAGLGR